MQIDQIDTGIVLDHITAGRGMEIYRHLDLDALDCTVAIIRNVKSARLGLKDIIKIGTDLPLDLDILGYIDAQVTVNIIRDGVLVEKRPLVLPERIVNVGVCRNPRCITSVEPELDQVFVLTDPVRGTYSCLYCEQAKT